MSVDNILLTKILIPHIKASPLSFATDKWETFLKSYQVSYTGLNILVRTDSDCQNRKTTFPIKHTEHLFHVTKQLHKDEASMI